MWTDMAFLILNGNLARHSTRRGGKRQSSPQRLNRSQRRRSSPGKPFALRKNRKKRRITALKIKRIRPRLARHDNGSLPEAARQLAAADLFATLEVQNRIRELIKLAKEQGY